MMYLIYATDKSDLPVLRELNFWYYPKYFLDPDGYIIRECIEGCDNHSTATKAMQKILKAHGFDTHEKIIRFLHSQAKKPAPKWLIPTYLRQLKYQREYHKQFFEKEKKDWEKMKETFGGNVLKMGRVDFRTDLDFTVRLSLSSGGYKRQIEYVKNNSQDIIDYVCAEIQKRQTVMNKIGSLNFYYVSRITVTRQSEVELMFSLKPKLEQLQ